MHVVASCANDTYIQQMTTAHLTSPLWCCVANMIWKLFQCQFPLEKNK